MEQDQARGRHSVVLISTVVGNSPLDGAVMRGVGASTAAADAPTAKWPLVAKVLTLVAKSPDCPPA